MGKATQLSDEGAVEALRMVAKSWLDNDGARAFAVVQQAGAKAAVEKLGETPPFFARRVLEVLQRSGKPEVTRWTEEAIDEVWMAESEGQAQVIDPVMLTIAGATLIGAILAARVRNIGAVEFYEGVPPELVRLLKAGEAILREPLVLGKSPG